jgi:hypothetical protein
MDQCWRVSGYSLDLKLTHACIARADTGTTSHAMGRYFGTKGLMGGCLVELVELIAVVHRRPLLGSVIPVRAPCCSARYGAATRCHTRRVRQRPSGSRVLPPVRPPSQEKRFRISFQRPLLVYTHTEGTQCNSLTEQCYAKVLLGLAGDRSRWGTQVPVAHDCHKKINLPQIHGESSIGNRCSSESTVHRT